MMVTVYATRLRLWAKEIVGKVDSARPRPRRRMENGIVPKISSIIVG